MFRYKHYLFTCSCTLILLFLEIQNNLMSKQSTLKAFGTRKMGVKLCGIHAKLAKEIAKDDANISGDSSEKQVHTLNFKI